MNPALKRLWAWLERRSENIAAALMLTMALSFFIQVGARYVLNKPVAWADELSVISGIWVILWSTSFVSRESDNIRFDMIYSKVSPKARRVLDAVSGLAFVTIFCVGFPAAWNYVHFMKIESTAALAWRFDLVFSVYLVFAATMILRHAWIVWCAISGRVLAAGPAA